MDLGFHINGVSGTNQGGRLAQEDRVLLIEHPRYQGCVLGIVADGITIDVTGTCEPGDYRELKDLHWDRSVAQNSSPENGDS